MRKVKFVFWFVRVSFDNSSQNQQKLSRSLYLQFLAAMYIPSIKFGRQADDLKKMKTGKDRPVYALMVLNVGAFLELLLKLHFELKRNLK